jgi:hypothetical protein
MVARLLLPLARFYDRFVASNIANELLWPACSSFQVFTLLYKT